MWHILNVFFTLPVLDFSFVSMSTYSHTGASNMGIGNFIYFSQDSGLERVIKTNRTSQINNSKLSQHPRI